MMVHLIAYVIVVQFLSFFVLLCLLYKFFYYCLLKVVDPFFIFGCGSLEFPLVYSNYFLSVKFCIVLV